MVIGLIGIAVLFAFLCFMAYDFYVTEFRPAREERRGLPREHDDVAQHHHKRSA